MRKATIFILAAMALMAFTISPVLACGKDQATQTSASTGTTDAKMVGEKAGCCAKGASMSAADCAAHCANMSQADLAKMCNYTGKLQMVNMAVKGMTCGGCETSVRASLEKIPGVVKVCAVSYKDNMAMVVIDPTKTKTDVLATTVSSKGYDAQIIPAVATTTTGTGAKACTGSKASCAGHADGAKAEETKATTNTDNQPH